MAKERYRVSEVIAAIQDGYTPSGAAELLGCAPNTVRDYCKRHESVMAALHEARECMVDLAEKSLRECVIQREPWAVALVLKTLGRGRGYTEDKSAQEVKDSTVHLVWDDGDA